MNKQTTIWISATRPKTLPAGAAPVILGLALSYSDVDDFNIFAALITLLCALCLQVSSNLINDYYDGVRGTDDSNRLGPQRATSMGHVLPQQMKKAFLITLGVSTILGSYLMFIAGTPIIIIGISSLFFAWAYTGGPLPLSYMGLGELFAFIFFGPVAVWGTYFIQTQIISYPLTVALGGISLGFLSSALMGVNNLRDTHQDRAKDKKTLSTIIGERSMRKLIMCFIISSLVCLTYMLWFITPYPFLLISCPLVFLLFIDVWKQVLFKNKGRELNQTLANIGKYLFITSLSSSLIIIYTNKG